MKSDRKDRPRGRKLGKLKTGPPAKMSSVPQPVGLEEVPRRLKKKKREHNKTKMVGGMPECTKTTAQETAEAQ